MRVGLVFRDPPLPKKASPSHTFLSKRDIGLAIAIEIKFSLKRLVAFVGNTLFIAETKEKLGVLWL